MTGSPRAAHRTRWGAPSAPRRTPRWVTWGAASVLALVLVWLLACWAVLQHPRTDEPSRSDALFVLGPPDRTRLTEAQRLMDAGVAPVLVVADPGAEDLGEASGRTYYARAQQVCAAEHAYEVICFRPDPSTTQGEALQLRELSEQRDWNHVSALTYRQHVTRSRLILGRCYAGELDVLAFDYPEVPRGLLREFAYQSGGFAKAALTPGCDQQLPWRPKSLD
ncbi:YdcF family protein [Kocuria sediminis]|uniref:YdcF family protein n=1 Tax=Kocuria sediminis TaxID=1038857 RepID=A0A6N8GVR1_9MICC|nr:YdcF family protein [Kocuria sediminis]MUN64894.1 YdcF family protein [Kocuria sediminis]